MIVLLEMISKNYVRSCKRCEIKPLRFAPLPSNLVARSAGFFSLRTCTVSISPIAIAS